MAQTLLFDCTTHPTPDGTWLRPDDGSGNTFEALKDEMDAHGVPWALAHGMGLGGYEEDTYAERARAAGDGILPVAFFDPDAVQTQDDVGAWLERAKDLGYVGVKIHPRLARLTYADERLPPLIMGAQRLGLAVLLCTYAWERSLRCAENSVECLARLLATVTDANLILVHAGGVRLLEHVELARAHRNVLLDLSLTLTKYEGSSIDLDLRFCFERFDERICVGSDSPEVSLANLRRRFEEFAADLPESKRENIAHRNLRTYLDL